MAKVNFSCGCRRWLDTWIVSMAVNRRWLEIQVREKQLMKLGRKKKRKGEKQGINFK